ncbi:SRPBCC family protein [Sorangium sp. So ce295]|uniref:SRPBCC family protein n=1 Tax=Sorangium sp. So ce295 TaxID=3133295 RepID=UPI003F6460F3
MTTKSEKPVHIYRVHIKATPEAVWEAITKPEWIEKYGYCARAEYDLRPGGKYQAFANTEMAQHGGPSVIIDGEVIEADPPRKLVQTWRILWDPEMKEEGFRRLTWEIEVSPYGITSLTVTHEVGDAPKTAAITSGAIKEAGGGWSYILSDLKTLLETGKTLSAA